jgi:hypothetical protein
MKWKKTLQVKKVKKILLVKKVKDQHEVDVLGGKCLQLSTCCIQDYLSGKQPYRQSNCETWKAQSSDVRRTNVSIRRKNKRFPWSRGCFIGHSGN